MKRALILVDIQNDFLPGGALAVPEGDAIIPIVNALQPLFDLVIATQDLHPADHGSFASNHDGRELYEVVDLNGLDQHLWPDHCVEDSHGAEFSKTLSLAPDVHIFPKGTDPAIDSYSGFFDNGRRKATGLGDFLARQGVEEVYLTGLATDFCVKYTALDAVSLGFRTFLIEDATRGVNLKEDDSRIAIEEMKQAGVQVLKSNELLVSA